MNKADISVYIDGVRQTLTRMADAIWDYAETAFEEYKSAALYKEFLIEQGFKFQEGVGGIPTAFTAEFGAGKPVVGILAEYDALSGLSQKAGSITQESAEYPAETGGGNGHGCGHNLLGIGSLGAALAVKEYLSANKIPGTVKLFGCPGEEGGSGKAFMARAGIFHGLDAAFCWHPMSINGIMDAALLANYQIAYRFTGRAAHAAASPHLGRSALDAVELMNVGVQFLREHVMPDARIHYAITNSGGFSPNVVQSRAEVLYLIRAPKLYQAEEIYHRVNKIAQGAAMMTETEVEIEFIKACANVVPNRTLAQVLYDNFKSQTLPEITPEERAFAESMKKNIASPSLGEADIVLGRNEEARRECLPLLEKSALCNMILPFSRDEPDFLYPFSSDVGDVSSLVPASQIVTACYALGTPAHTWQIVSQVKTSFGHKGMILAAKVLAASCIDILEHPEIAAEAKAELERRLDGKPYKSVIPPEVKPQPISKIGGGGKVSGGAISPP